jgi:hypothetical protein
MKTQLHRSHSPVGERDCSADEGRQIDGMAFYCLEWYGCWKKRGKVVVVAFFLKQSLTGVQCRISMKKIYMTPTGSFLLVLQTLLCVLSKSTAHKYSTYGSARLWLELATG